IGYFQPHLAAGRKLCLMPVSRLLIEAPIINPIPGYVFCPAGAVNLQSLNIVWNPASAWEDGETRLGWAKSAATQVSIEEFNCEALLAFTVELVAWVAFFEG